MRAVIQRVSQASVVVDGATVGAIDRGFVVLLGVEAGDTAEDLQWLVKKVGGQRVFADADGRMNLDVAAIGGSFLVISQFTLMASTRKGNRPGFTRSEDPELAKATYERFCEELHEITNCPVERGIFAADMNVNLTNDGPVTLIIDSRLRE